MTRISARRNWAGLVLGALLGMTGQAFGHCDTLDGPVIADARAALKAGDVVPVLKWVPKVDEDEIRQAFQKTLAVRASGTEARELADRYFFETLVRVHRAGEGAPYTGIKPAEEEATPDAIAKADQSLETGDVDDLASRIGKAVEAGVRERFAAAAEAKKHAGESVEAGRRYVAAYVDFVHYVEGVHDLTAGGAHHHGHAEAAHAEHAPAETSHAGERKHEH